MKNKLINKYICLFYLSYMHKLFLGVKLFATALPVAVGLIDGLRLWFLLFV